MKTDVNVPTVRNKQKKEHSFAGILKFSEEKKQEPDPGVGSGPVIKLYGSGIRNLMKLFVKTGKSVLDTERIKEMQH